MMAAPSPRANPVDVPAEVRRLLAAHLDLGPGCLDGAEGDALRLEQIGADSLDGVELVMAFEQTFDVEISDDDAEKVIARGEGTVGALIALVETAVRARRAVATALATPVQQLPLAVWRDQFRVELIGARSTAEAAAKRWAARRDTLRARAPADGSEGARLVAMADDLARRFTELAQSQADQLAELDIIIAEDAA